MKVKQGDATASFPNLKMIETLMPYCQSTRLRSYTMDGEAVLRGRDGNGIRLPEG